MFFHDALIWLSIAFDAVLKCAVAFRKLSHNLIGTWQGITKRKGSVETDYVPDRKAMDTRDVSCPHDDTCFDVTHSLPHALQAAGRVQQPGCKR
jgi:hypothetical protein